MFEDSKLYLFFLISSIDSFLETYVLKKMLNKVSNITLLFIKYFINFAIILIISGIQKNDKLITQEMKTIPLKKIFYLILFCITGYYINNNYFKYLKGHDVSSLDLIGTIMYILVSFIGSNLLLSEKITSRKIFGIAIILLGYYLFASESNNEE